MKKKMAEKLSKNNINNRIVIDTLCWLIEDAFSGDASHALMANLRNVRQDDWLALPPGGNRSIADILEHVGWCKWMYENYAFGDAALRGDQPPLIPIDGAKARPQDELLAWLKEGHDKWLSSVRALPDDDELGRDRMTNWGELLPTRDIIQIMIAHDYYHAGEINHIRSILQGNDRWEYES
jgi:uncharacterized damage-inducible protein DinB